MGTNPPGTAAARGVDVGPVFGLINPDDAANSECVGPDLDLKLDWEGWEEVEDMGSHIMRQRRIGLRCWVQK